ncbi:hypothetical protein PG997_013287 [Apiospora hydei]|uniref:F-box domain-containing protein n=1 Tax=Apiospora hydei TaxID=1337664 RepID=A0ABR1V5S1_9PEZI
MIGSLPTELLLQILAIDSAADLCALIRASPVAHRVFVSAKRVVLPNILSRALGPVLRDAVIATLSTPAESTSSKLHPEIRGALELPIESAFALVRVNRDVQFFTDEFELLRLPELRKLDPEAAVSQAAYFATSSGTE